MAGWDTWSFHVASVRQKQYLVAFPDPNNKYLEILFGKKIPKILIQECAKMQVNKKRQIFF